MISEFTHGPDAVTMHGSGFKIIISPRCSMVENLIYLREPPKPSDNE
jgi:hypothetical protein